MSHVVRPVTADEFVRSVEIMSAAFTMHTPEDMIKRKQQLSSPDRVLGVFDDAEMIATISHYEFDLTVPGSRTIPIAGVADAGVLPTRRRQGVFQNLVYRQLEDLRNKGFVAAMLNASEDAIYPRFGYGPATAQATLSVETRDMKFLDAQPDGRLEIVSAEETRKRLPDLHERFRMSCVGDLSRSDTWWDDFVTEHGYKGDESEPFHLFYTSPEGSFDGYATLRPTEKSFADSLDVECLFATTAQAELALLQHIVTRDLITSVTFEPSRVDSPLRWLVENRRAVETTVGDQSWLRLLDVKSALESRSYNCDGTLTMKVNDSLFVENNATFAIEIEDGIAGVTTAAANADFEINVADLGSAYLGGTKLSALANAGRINASNEALHLADMMFSTQRPPFASLFF